MEIKQKKRYDPEEYQRNKEKYMERQRKCRNNPKNRERYLKDAKERSKKWYSIPENRLRRNKYNKESWLRQIKKLEEKAGRPRPKNLESLEVGYVIDVMWFWEKYAKYAGKKEEYVLTIATKLESLEVGYVIDVMWFWEK